MTDDPRFPHLSEGYAWTGQGDMAARPQNIHEPTHPMTSASGEVTVTDHTALSGRALEEMSVPELRKRAAVRGIQSRGLRKPALIAALRRE